MDLTFLETCHHEDYWGQPDFQDTWLEGWDITARPGWTFSTKLGVTNSAFAWFSILPISCKNGFEDSGSQSDFQNLWLEGWDITAKPGWTGSSPPLSRTTSPAQSRMSTSVIKSVFESATSLFAFSVFPEKFTFYFKHTSYIVSLGILCKELREYIYMTLAN